MYVKSWGSGNTSDTNTLPHGTKIFGSGNSSNAITLPHETNTTSTSDDFINNLLSICLKHGKKFSRF